MSSSCRSPSPTKAKQSSAPAVVVSSARYNTERPDLILMAITSQVRSPAAFGEVIVQHWQAAKLLKLSAIKPVFTTLDKRLVRKSLGRLHETDRASLKAAVQIILG